MLIKKISKPILLLLLIVCGFTVNAKNYYISNSGNDANSGTDPSVPWKTINKLNSFKGFVPGDNILFRRGDVFYGSITVSNSGTSGNPITYGAYGTGAKPSITGFTNVTSWNNLGGNIWESTGSVSSLPYTNMILFNGVNTPMGRYPNSGYLSYQSHNNNSSITSNELSGSTNWKGAGIAIKKKRWAIELGKITNQSGGTVSYSDPGVYSPTDAYGFFIQNDPRTLDVVGEWYYDPNSKKVRIYNTKLPDNFQIATLTTLLNLIDKKYITIDNISFKGSNGTSLWINNSSSVIVKNCEVIYCGENGIKANHAENINLEYNEINHVNYTGIRLEGSSLNPVVRYNSVKNINMIPGMGPSALEGSGIFTNNSNSLVEYNVLDSVGSKGVYFDGVNSKVKNNLISNFCMILDDGGGIYIGSRNTFKGRIITGNIVLNSKGTGDGTYSDGTLSSGIYIDDDGAFVTISNNTVANGNNSGIKIHNAHDITVINNTLYNNGGTSYSRGAIEFMYNDISRPPIRNTIMKNNVLFAKTDIQLAFFHTTILDLNDIKLFGISDSNYFARPISNNNYINLRTASNGYPGFSYSLLGWIPFLGQDIHSLTATKTISNVNDLRFEYNASSNSKTISLDANYIDVKGKTYNGIIVLAPYTSAVLIKNGPLSNNQLPTANAGQDQTITLPTNSVSLSGSGKDNDGSIFSYSWTKISGPSGENIENENSASTTVRGLVEGVYEFELKVVDNAGGIAKDTIKIIVKSGTSTNIAPVSNAGSDRTIDDSKNSIVLIGRGTDQDGTIASYSWAKISGPSSGAVISPSSAETGVNDLVEGVYVFELTVTDNKGAIGKSTMKVTVNGANTVVTPNIAPVANTGYDRTIQFPKNSIVLPGSGKDEDGTIVSYSWTKVSGPSGGTIIDPSSAQTGLNDLNVGVYAYELTVTDNKGAIGKSTLKVTVKANGRTALADSNVPPLADAGYNRVVELPKNSIILQGSGTDKDGSIVSYLWTKISGPSSGTMIDASSANLGVNDLVEGVYQYQLKVTDNDGATALSTVTVTVNDGNAANRTLRSAKVNAGQETIAITASSNLSPSVSAGNDTTIYLPGNSVILNGSATDVDGSVAGYNWNQISGPSKSTIVSGNSAVTNINDLVAGTYSFELAATDDAGSKGKDTLNVVVALGKQSAVLNSIKFYPNPVQDVASLEINTAGTNTNVRIVMTDIAGKTIFTKELGAVQNSVNERINMSGYVNGVYFITVLADGIEQQTIKVMKL